MALRKILTRNPVTGDLEELQANDTVANLIATQTTTSLANGEITPITKGMVVYISGVSQGKKAQANASATRKAFGLVADATVAAAATATIATDGIVTATTAQWDALTGDTGGLIAGSSYYLSATIVGGMTKTPLTAAGSYHVEIGQALSTTDIELSIEKPILLA